MTMGLEAGRAERRRAKLMELNVAKAGRAESKAETSNGLNKVEEQEGEFGRASLSHASQWLEQS